MLNSDKKNKYSYICVVRKKISERNKNHNPPPPPLQVKWSVSKTNQIKSNQNQKFYLKSVHLQAVQT